jgi:hypothetical protein
MAIAMDKTVGRGRGSPQRHKGHKDKHEEEDERSIHQVEVTDKVAFICPSLCSLFVNFVPLW